MTPTESRQLFAHGFLAQLAAAGIPHALQRNRGEITSGRFKDIDLIAPQRSIARMLRVLHGREDATVVVVSHGLSRSQITVELAGPDCPRVPIDIDFQVTLIGDGIGSGRLTRFSARSVAFCDLKTCVQSEAGGVITHLDPASELLLLQNHARRKPKKAYLARIAELEERGVCARAIAPAFRRRGTNLLRRYGLILRALPGWITAHLRPVRAGSIRPAVGDEDLDKHATDRRDS